MMGPELSQVLSQQPESLQLEESSAAILASHRLSPIRAIRNHEQILGLTTQLFPGAEISVHLETDPEIGEDQYFAVSIVTGGEIEEIAAQDRRWHQQLLSVAPETASFYRLLIEVR